MRLHRAVVLSGACVLALAACQPGEGQEPQAPAGDQSVAEACEELDTMLESVLEEMGEDLYAVLHNVATEEGLGIIEAFAPMIDGLDGAVAALGNEEVRSAAEDFRQRVGEFVAALDAVDFSSLDGGEAELEEKVMEATQQQTANLESSIMRMGELCD